MQCGYAYHVQFPRRPEQSYVCTDAAYVIKDILLSVRDINWKVNVSLIAFRGETALSITTRVEELCEIEPTLYNWFDVIADELVSIKR